MNNPSIDLKERPLRREVLKSQQISTKGTQISKSQEEIPLQSFPFLSIQLPWIDILFFSNPNAEIHHNKQNLNQYLQQHVINATKILGTFIFYLKKLKHNDIYNSTKKCS